MVLCGRLKGYACVRPGETIVTINTFPAECSITTKLKLAGCIFTRQWGESSKRKKEIADLWCHSLSFKASK